MPSKNRLFPTTVIGSLPRPAWVRDVILARKGLQISGEEAEQWLDTAIPFAIAIQERAGLDEITDGEWRRESYVKVFADRVHGFQKDINTSGGLPHPAVVSKIEYKLPIAVNEVKFVSERTGRRVKATLPSPYIIGRRMWHPEHSKAAYPKRETLMQDCVPILQREIESLRQVGVDTIQLDEPWLSVMVDARFRAKERIEDPRYEMDLCVDMLNQTLDSVKGVATAVHLCHAHFDRKHGSEGPYDLIMPALKKIRVGMICMEYATPVAGGMVSLKQFPEQTRLGLGCIDHCDRHIETPEEVVARVEQAMGFVDKERIALHPDCGFSPSVQNPMDLDEAYLKLKSMGAAAELLRAKHG